jgi:hypothetical protein
VFASVHTDRTGRVYVSDDHRASGWNGSEHVALEEAIPIPPGTRLVPLEREAEAFGRDGRMRGLGRGRTALAAVLPAGCTRLLFPSYAEERGDAPLALLPYTAVASAPGGDLVVAATRHGSVVVAATRHGSVVPSVEAREGGTAIQDALRSRPGNDLVRQLVRCSREHECLAARAALAGGAELPVPIGALSAEQPLLPIALRSGYPGAPAEQAALHPIADEILQLATPQVTRIAFGRACDGDPLLALRPMEEAVSLVHARHPNVEIHVETTGCSTTALRRLIDAGVNSVTIRFASALPDTYRALHGPVAHEWSDVRASIALAAERARLTLALLLLPGVSDRPAESDAIVGLVGDLPGGALELRDLGADPVRALAALPRGRPRGMRSLIDRLSEADHFELTAAAKPAAV